MAKVMDDISDGIYKDNILGCVEGSMGGVCKCFDEDEVVVDGLSDGI